MAFLSVLRSATLNDLEWRNERYFELYCPTFRSMHYILKIITAN